MSVPREVPVWYTILLIGIFICALTATQAQELLQAVIWLALTNALLAILIFELGAREIAVIELSVGGGLIPILITFALNLIGEQPTQRPSTAYRLLSAGLVVLVVGALANMILRNLPPASIPRPQVAFSTWVWEQRSEETFLQLLLMFAGTLSVLSLIAERSADSSAAESAPVAISPAAPTPIEWPQLDDMPEAPHEEVEDVPVLV